MFGGAPAFGSSPSFGAPPVFGGSPQGGLGASPSQGYVTIFFFCATSFCIVF